MTPDRGPWCANCQMYRALTPGGLCPVCADLARKAAKR